MVARGDAGLTGASTEARGASRPLRVLNITAQRPDATGSGTYLAELVRCQDAAGCATAVVCGIAKGDPIGTLPSRTRLFPVLFDSPELPFHVCGMSDAMPYPSTRYRDLTPQMARQFTAAFARVIGQAAAEFQPDVVICHHLYLATAVARETLPGLPMAAVCHSTDLRQMAQHGLERERIITGVRGLDVIFSLHEAQRGQIVRTYGVEPGRITVVGAGYNAQKFSPAPVRLVFAGKVCRKKGMESLLAALDSIEPIGPTAAGSLESIGLANSPRGLALSVAGGLSPDEDERDRIAKLAQECRWPVEMLGRLSQEELARVYQESDVFVLPSFFEGLPLVVIEALACGCRVVATELPGVRPWVEANVPGAPVTWVAPPRMEDVDRPLAADLPAFEARLAAAIRETAGKAAATRPTCDVSALSWERVSEHVLQCLKDVGGVERGVGQT